MSRVSHFQSYSQPENHATNNTLLVLRYFYQLSPFKLQRVLSSLLEMDLSVGLAFEQQVRGCASVPDALITREPLHIFIETKRGGNLDLNQIRRHLKSIADVAVAGCNDFLSVSARNRSRKPTGNPSPPRRLRRGLHLRR